MVYICSSKFKWTIGLHELSQAEKKKLTFGKAEQIYRMTTFSPTTILRGNHGGWRFRQNQLGQMADFSPHLTFLLFDL